MGRSGDAAQRTSWKLADFFDGISAASRTLRDFAVTVELDVRRQVFWKADGIADFFAFLQGKLSGRSINLA